MPKDKAQSLVTSYLVRLKEQDIPVTEAYIFGSQVRGDARKDSDIDVAIVSPWFDPDDDAKRVKLWLCRRPHEYDIEPHGFTPEDFANEADPMVCEIKKTGERVA